jgi:S1-C subfamily serine protease
MAKEFLSRNRIPYTEHNVAYDSNAVAEMVRLSGQRGVPVIVVDQEVIVGFDRPRLEQLLAGQKPGMSLGLRVTDATKVAKKKGLSTSVGAYVDRVNPGSLAEKAGVQPSDVITEINGWPVANVEDLKAASASLGPGKRATLTVLRQGKGLRLEFQP